MSRALGLPTRRLAADYGLCAAVGWVICQTSAGLLLGPHIPLERAVVLGSTTGAWAGLLTGLGQWAVLRRRVRQAGGWIPATTVGGLLTGLAGGLLLHLARPRPELYVLHIPLEGLVVSALLGVVCTLCQWPLARGWAGLGRAVRWAAQAVAGSALAALVGWLAGTGLVLLLGGLFHQQWWQVVLLLGYGLCTAVGGALAGWSNARSLRQLLAGRAQSARPGVPPPAPDVRPLRPGAGQARMRDKRRRELAAAGAATAIRAIATIGTKTHAWARAARAKGWIE